MGQGVGGERSFKGVFPGWCGLSEGEWGVILGSYRGFKTRRQESEARLRWEGVLGVMARGGDLSRVQRQFLSRRRDSVVRYSVLARLGAVGMDAGLLEVLRRHFGRVRQRQSVDHWGGLRRDVNGGVGVKANRLYYGRRLVLAGKTLDWCDRHLRIGEGMLVGDRFKFMGWFREFILDAYGVGVHSAGLSVARKNGKTASLAAFEIGCLVGPLRRRGYCCLVASEDKRKTGPFRDTLVGMCVESGLMSKDSKKRGVWQEGLGVQDGAWVFQVLVRKNAGGDVLYSVGRREDRLGDGGEEVEFGSVMVLPFGEHIGDALRANKVIIDEGGRLGVVGTTRYKKQRTAWNTLRSAMGSGGEMFMVMSAQYNGSMFREMRARAEGGKDKSLVFHVYAAAGDCRLDDEGEWERANPALVYGVKDRKSMRDDVEMARVNELDERDFREQELNQPQGNALQMLISEAVWRQCVMVELDKDIREYRRGGCFWGVDMGGPASMSCIVVGWYETGFIEAYGAFPGVVRDKSDGEGRVMGMGARGARDGVGDAYVRMERAGELVVYDGEYKVPYGRFLMDVWGRILNNADRREARVLHIAMDQYMDADFYQATDRWLKRAGSGRFPGLDAVTRRALRFPSFRKSPNEKHKDIQSTKECIVGGRWKTCVGYGGGVLSFSIRNATVVDRNGRWNFHGSADGRNDAAVAMSTVGGQYKWEDQNRNRKRKMRVVFV